MKNASKSSMGEWGTNSSPRLRITVKRYVIKQPGKGEWGQNLAPKLVVGDQEWAGGGKRQGERPRNPRDAKRVRREAPRSGEGENEPVKAGIPPDKREQGPETGPKREEIQQNINQKGMKSTFGQPNDGQGKLKEPRPKGLTVKQILIKMAQLREERLRNGNRAQLESESLESDPPEKPSLSKSSPGIIAKSLD